MNTPARRDGTPDRRKRHSDPPRGGARGGAGRSDRRDNPRGAAGTDRGGSGRGDRYGRGDDSYGRGRDTRGSRPGRSDDRPDYGRTARTGRGDDRYGRPDSAGRGGDRFARGRAAGAGRGDSDARYGRDENRYGRGENRYGRDDSRTGRGENRYGRDDSRTGRGENRYGRDDSRTGRGENRYGRDDSRTGRGENRYSRDNTRSGRGDGGASWDRGSATGQSRAAAPRPKTSAPKPKKRKTPPTVLSFAKPARHQNVETEATGPKKLPWGEGERLQKVLAKAGVASRRAAEELIDQGRVEVDGAIVREQGLRIDPDTAVVRVDGVRVVVRDEQVYLALNKPKGFQSTMSDEMGRPCVGDIVAERVMAGQRLFHVGRLDADTEGLLLLTNDGDLAHRLMHPSFEVSKTYLATVHGEIQRGVGKQLRDGVELDDGPAKVDKFQVLEVAEGKSLVRVILHEGRKHIVRRLLAEVGYPVIALVRTHIGPVALGDQRSGALRVLGRDEIGKLYEAVEL
ncbi:pseudouridine synthase [Nocardia sp. NPDC052254]|uniref:pseudouridine synthase n=1 Tax=Nocardia sp. NPDC052254 TaxID=3155681 RepID=UPI003428459E